MKLTAPSQYLIAFIFVSVALFSSCEEVVVTPPVQTISFEEANRLEETYKKTRAAILNDTLGYEDTREFWFSLDTIKKYISYIEQEGTRMGKKNLGLRVYLGAYPSQGNYPDPGYSTVFMVPTVKSEGNPLKQGFLPVEDTHENLDSLNALNYGHGGKPPHDY
ncbi:hypothetical protein KXJ69_00800 [Aureisphaera sp. CAU 1614]|uniref:Uncharacterized protein n=1 Tax=Halomarinibacterium sedimenti TaxID=2857106 RepID=A0A9X1FLN0_9FLAO|nr:hypothetical protein [Halomarinibacterium sedimenti]MBW2936622.1 hypothetical protein [Halomarinibacterium sedimenti]